MLRHIAIGVIACLVALPGCKPAHPSKIVQDPSFEPARVSAILIAPFVSSVPEADDPQRQSERIMNKTLAEFLSLRADYRFVSADQFQGAVNRANLAGQWKAFQEGWNSNHAVDREFLTKLKTALNVEVLLLPQVYLWVKDEADYREQATASATQVGATIALIDMASGTILWEADDQNYREAVRSEDRETISTAGIDRRVEGKSGTGRDVYAAPPYEEVAQIVIECLVNAIPERIAESR